MGDIDTTVNHPFYVIGKDWVAAGYLVESDEVYNLDGTTSTILGFEIVVLDKAILVYNLEVEDFHSYFVGCVPVLVHNVCRFEGKNVQQNDKLFDPSQIDARGRTKLQRMKQGLAPVGYDGKSVNLHHIDQTNASDILEISATQYHADYSKLHTNTGQSASLINRSDFSKWRSRYWQFRAEDFLKA